MSKKINESRLSQMNKVEAQVESLAARLRKDGFTYQADQLEKIQADLLDVQMSFSIDAKLEEE